MTDTKPTSESAGKSPALKSLERNSKPKGEMMKTCEHEVKVTYHKNGRVATRVVQYQREGQEEREPERELAPKEDGENPW